MPQQARSRSCADLAIFGAAIRTLDRERPSASAVAIRDGTIVAVGDDAEVRRHVDAATEVIDGRDATLVPGLVDSHMHPIWGAELSVGVDLNGLTTLDAVRGALAREAGRQPAGAWVRGWGLDYAAFAGEAIDGRSLADAVGGAPAVLTFYDLHTAVATPRALELAGIDHGREVEGGSEIVRDGGEPTGELREPGAYQLVLDAIPPESPAERRGRVRRLLTRLNAVGLTGVHVMDGSPETFGLLRELEGAGELTARLVVPLWQKPGTAFEEMEDQLALRNERGRRWRGGVAKFFIDGVVEPGTAWLYEADTQGDGTRPYWPDPDRYVAAVKLFATAGFQCVTHAVGDRAVRAVLDAYRAAGAIEGAARPSAPHRVEHLELLMDEDLHQVVADGVVASMQPLHMRWRRGDGSDAFTTRLGASRAADAFRTRDLVDAGARVALGSDWPVAPFDPRLGMAWARLRRRPGDPDAPAFAPGQALTAAEALAGYTTWAAAAVGEAAQGGRIAPGMRADITAFAGDPLRCPADELVDLPLRLTVVDGAVVFRDAGMGAGG